MPNGRYSQPLLIHCRMVGRTLTATSRSHLPSSHGFLSPSRCMLLSSSRWHPILVSSRMPCLVPYRTPRNRSIARVSFEFSYSTRGPRTSSRSPLRAGLTGDPAGRPFTGNTVWVRSPHRTDCLPSRFTGNPVCDRVLSEGGPREPRSGIRYGLYRRRLGSSDRELIDLVEPATAVRSPEPAIHRKPGVRGGFVLRRRQSTERPPVRAAHRTTPSPFGS